MIGNKSSYAGPDDKPCADGGRYIAHRLRSFLHRRNICDIRCNSGHDKSGTDAPSTLAKYKMETCVPNPKVSSDNANKNSPARIMIFLPKRSTHLPQWGCN